jgi:DNA-binding MarR family transcriptional regulator
MARPDKPPIEARPPADDPLAFQVLNEVGILSQLSANRAARLLAPGLNLSQFSLLNHLSRLGGERSLVQLASAMQVTKAAMTNTVTRLQAKGLLAVQPDPQDGRGKRVSLTPAGLAARQQAVQQLGQGLAEMGQAVSAPELADALVALRKLRVWFDANR